MQRQIVPFALLALFAACNPYPEMCRKSIEHGLTSPASAEWSDITTERWGGFAEVRGKVDSDNAYGAKLRSHFICQVDLLGIRWATADVPFDDYASRMVDGDFVTMRKGIGEGAKVFSRRTFFSEDEADCTRRLLLKIRASRDLATAAWQEAVLKSAVDTGCPPVITDVLKRLQRGGMRPKEAIREIDTVVALIKRDQGGPYYAPYLR